MVTAKAALQPEKTQDTAKVQLPKFLSEIKEAFLDVDNTLLCLRMYDDGGQNEKTGKRVIGQAKYEDWLRYNINTNAYLHCFSPHGIRNLVSALHRNGAKIYGLTECSNSFEYNAKYNRLAECFPDVFKHHGDLIAVDSRHKKVMVMEMMAERDKIRLDHILFVDDSYQEVMEAFDTGIMTMHTTEAIERFQTLR